jgi:carbonic anhydrase
MLTFHDDDFKGSIEQHTGIRPPWAAEAFGDLDGPSPFISQKDSVRGFVSEAETGKLRDVS